jgi:uncharacterized protein (UPF0147 family)
MATVRRFRNTFFEGGTTVMSTLAVVEEILRETAVPMSVREIVERAGARLPSKSKTPDTVVARDLSMDIKRKGETSLFTRTSPGRYTLKTLVSATTSEVTTAMGTGARPVPTSATTQPMTSLGARKPAAAAPAQPRARTDSDVGNGFAG